MICQDEVEVLELLPSQSFPRREARVYCMFLVERTLMPQFSRGFVNTLRPLVESFQISVSTNCRRRSSITAIVLSLIATWILAISAPVASAAEAPACTSDPNAINKSVLPDGTYQVSWNATSDEDYSWDETVGDRRSVGNVVRHGSYSGDALVQYADGCTTTLAVTNTHADLLGDIVQTDTSDPCFNYISSTTRSHYEAAEPDKYLDVVSTNRMFRFEYGGVDQDGNPFMYFPLHGAPDSNLGDPYDPRTAVFNTPFQSTTTFCDGTTDSSSQDLRGDYNLTYAVGRGRSPMMADTGVLVKIGSSWQFDHTATYPSGRSGGSGDIEVDTHMIVSPMLVASFTAQANPNATASFDATASTGDVTDYVWSFGDGGADVVLHQPITEHAYDAPGDYLVTLRVKDGHGTSSEPFSQIVTASCAGEQTAAAKGSFLPAASTADAGSCGLEANAGGPYTVPRGSWLTLDGSSSSGPFPLTSFEWQFLPGADCPSGTSLSTTRSASTNPRLRVFLLCDLSVTLTVRDAESESATASTIVDVTPRTANGWDSTQELNHQDGSLSDKRTPDEPVAVSTDFVPGVNESACTTKSHGLLILCPVVGKSGPLAGSVYMTKQVADPTGPFANYHYVDQTALRIDRVALYNPNLFKTSIKTYPDPANKGTDINWYNYNLRIHSETLTTYLQAVRDHEGWGQGGSPENPTITGHTGAMAVAIAANRPNSDPLLWLEGQFGVGLSDLTARIDKRLREMQYDIAAASSDPLNSIFSGRLAFWDRQFKRWTDCEVSVGGSTYLSCPTK
jgi:PKD repeat protein